MKDISDTLEYKGQKYPLVFSLNVLEEIQQEYGTFSAWIKKIYNEDEDDENFEPDMRAVKFVYFGMINEGIDIENEEKDEKDKRKPVTMAQVGRMLTEIGTAEMYDKLNKLALASNQPGEDSKNE